MENFSSACIQLKRRKELCAELMTDLISSASQDAFHRKAIHLNNPHVHLGLRSLVVIKTGQFLAHASAVCLVSFFPEHSNNTLFHVAMHKQQKAPGQDKREN